MHDIVKDLYDSFPPEEKSSFYHAYLYLKYLDYFLHHTAYDSGMTTKEPPEGLDEGLLQMIKAIGKEIGENYGNLDTDIYHGKIVKLKDAIQLVTQKHDVSLSAPEQVVPFRLAKDIVLKNPGSIAVGECPCRATQENPCLPMDVCLFVGDPHASFIADQNPKFRKISQDEAVTILEEEHKRGHVHGAYFKTHLGNRFFAICNCCSCCCQGIKMFNLLEGVGSNIVSSGYVAEVGPDCIGCGDCLDTCHFNAITIDEDEQTALVNEAICMGCGVCEDMCSTGVITLRREPSKGDPLDLEALLSVR